MYICVYVCMYGHAYSKSMNQPGKVANPARGELNREYDFFPCPRSRLKIWSRETASVVVPSRPASAGSPPYILRLNLVLTCGIPPEFRGGIHLFISNRHTPAGQSRVYRVTQLRTDDVHRGRGGKEKEWTNCVQSDIRAFGIAGDWKATALKAEVWVETVTGGWRRFMAAWRKEEVDAARHRQEKREATRLRNLLSQMVV